MWTKAKPKLSKECLLLTGTIYRNEDFEYTLFQIKKIYDSGIWYYGICESDGEEWGDYSDLKADKYLIMDLIKNN